MILFLQKNVNTSKVWCRYFIVQNFKKKFLTIIHDHIRAFFKFKTQTEYIFFFCRTTNLNVAKTDFWLTVQQWPSYWRNTTNRPTSGPISWRSGPRGRSIGAKPHNRDNITNQVSATGDPAWWVLIFIKYFILSSVPM